MTTTHRTDEVGWLWVVVQTAESGDQLVGQHVKGEETPFIPAFRSRNEADSARPLMALSSEGTFEVQAMQRDELLRMAEGNGFFVRILSETGEILEEPTSG